MRNLYLFHVHRVDKGAVDLDVINRYRWPSLTRYWDRCVPMGVRHVDRLGDISRPRALSLVLG